MWELIGSLMELLSFWPGSARWEEEHLRKVHSRLGKGLCWNCEYDMRQAPSTICPECGRDQSGYLAVRYKARCRAERAERKVLLARRM